MKKRITTLALTGALFFSVFAGCGFNKNDTVATLGDQKITLGIANMMCRYEQARSEDQYKLFYGSDVWSRDLWGDGTTVQERVKSDIMESIKTLYILKNHMGDMKVSLSEEEKTKITEAAKAFMDENTKESLKEINADQALIEEMLTLYTVQQKMYEAMIADVDRNVSDEEANMRAYTYLRENAKGKYGDDSQYKEYTEEEVKQLKEKLTGLASAVTDPSKFEELAKDAGFTVQTGTYASDDSALEADVKKALDGLTAGKISGLLETDSNFYIVRVDSETDKDATENNRKNIIARRESEAYTNKLKEWEEGVDWKIKDKVLAKIQFTNHLTQEEETTEGGSETTEGASGTTEGTSETTEGTSETTEGASGTTESTSETTEAGQDHS